MFRKHPVFAEDILKCFKIFFEESPHKIIHNEVSDRKENFTDGKLEPFMGLEETLNVKIFMKNILNFI